jgi:hypothetical protein
MPEPAGGAALAAAMGQGQTPRSLPEVLPNWHKLERGSHLHVGAAPHELGRKCPEVDPVFLAKAHRADPVLLVVMCRTKADAKGVMRLAPDTGIGGRAEMRELGPPRRASGNTAAMSSHPTTMTGPDRLHRDPRPHFWRLYFARESDHRASARMSCGPGIDRVDLGDAL